jgi:hypothetical protein
MKNLIQVSIIHLLIVFNHSAVIAFVENDDYRRYHEQIMEAEKLAATNSLKKPSPFTGKFSIATALYSSEITKLLPNLPLTLKQRRKPSKSSKLELPQDGI